MFFFARQEESESSRVIRRGEHIKSKYLPIYDHQDDGYHRDEDGINGVSNYHNVLFILCDNFPIIADNMRRWAAFGARPHI